MASVELWHRITDRWRKDEVPIRHGVVSQEIDAFQAKYGVFLFAPVRDYFMFVDGTGDQMEGGLYRFWPLSEVRPVDEVLDDTEHFSYPDRFAYPDCFVFADHCIECWDYAVKLTSNPLQPAPVFRVTASDPPGEMMAPSFHDFMSSYVDDPDSII